MGVLSLDWCPINEHRGKVYSGKTILDSVSSCTFFERKETAISQLKYDLTLVASRIVSLSRVSVCPIDRCLDSRSLVGWNHELENST